MTTYPLHLDLTGRRVVVVGGGPVAARRAAACVEAGASVVVVADAVCEDLAELERTRAVVVVRRRYLHGDLAGAWLVHAATGDRQVDDAVAAEADELRTWCVRADDGRSTPARTPAVARAADLVISVGTDGPDADPRRVRAVRDAISLTVDCGELPLRRHRPGPGRVSLVGGGPGDATLLTVRARRLLAEADVVVIDRLAPQDVLDELDPDVLVIDVGKAPNHHPVPQDEINRLLVEHARAGRHVVRLKGGDPYVFGRGGEELAHCRDANVDVEVVPGVTSAFAVPAAAGIPVTHRGLSRQVTILSGHEDADWSALASVGGTLVFLMGIAGLPRIAEGLVSYGMDPGTPVAIVERGFSQDQRTTCASLEHIVEEAARREVRSPAVIVVGDVAAIAELTPEASAQ